MEVKKSAWAERDCRPLSNATHQHHTAILERQEDPLGAHGDDLLNTRAPDGPARAKTFANLVCKAHNRLGQVQPTEITPEQQKTGRNRKIQTCLSGFFSFIFRILSVTFKFCIYYNTFKLVAKGNNAIAVFWTQFLGCFKVC